MSTRINRASRRTLPRGFTIIELIVSVVILSIGVLGLAATAAVVTKQMGGGSQETIAATIARKRFETLSSRSCTDAATSASLAAGATGGPVVSRGITEWWTVSAGPTASTRVLKDSLRLNTRAGVRTRVFRTTLVCRD